MKRRIVRQCRKCLALVLRINHASTEPQGYCANCGWTLLRVTDAVEIPLFPDLNKKEGDDSLTLTFSTRSDFYLTGVLTAIIGGYFLFDWGYALWAIILGIPILYFSLAGMFNRNRIFLSQEGMTVSSWPFPVRPSRYFARNRIDQLFVEEKDLMNRQEIFENRFPDANDIPQESLVMFNVGLRTVEGEWHRLTPYTKDEELCMSLEVEIEKFFQIKDRPVAGEYIPEE